MLLVFQKRSVCKRGVSDSSFPGCYQPGFIFLVDSSRRPLLSYVYCYCGFMPQMLTFLTGFLRRFSSLVCPAGLATCPCQPLPTALGDAWGNVGERVMHGGRSTACFLWCWCGVLASCRGSRTMGQVPGRGCDKTCVAKPK